MVQQHQINSLDPYLMYGAENLYLIETKKADVRESGCWRAYLDLFNCTARYHLSLCFEYTQL